MPATNAQTLAGQSSCYICFGSSLMAGMGLVELSNISQGGVVPPTPPTGSVTADSTIITVDSDIITSDSL